MHLPTEGRGKSTKPTEGSVKAGVLVITLSVVVIGCARISAERHVYEPVSLTTTDMIAVTFTYEMGSSEQTTSARGTETKVVNKGEERRFLALRDDIAFTLRDYGYSIVTESHAAYLVQIVPTVRQTDCTRTCNVIETLSLVIVRRSAIDRPLARIRLENAKGGGAKTRDADFARRAAAEIRSAIGGK